MGLRADQFLIQQLSQQYDLDELEKNQVWKPFKGPQTLAIDSLADEIFYGGSAGGGKTDLLLGCAFTKHTKSIIYRREFPQFRDIIDRGDELLSRFSIQFNMNRSAWRDIPGPGFTRMVELGAVPLEKDLEKFRGRPHDFIGFDEITGFPEKFYRFLNAWNRTENPRQKCQIIAAGNPPTNAEGEWVIRYWGAWLDAQNNNPAKPGELRWFAVLGGQDIEVEGPELFEYKGEMIQPKSRTFIPARIEDNPILMATDYRARLQALPEPLRTQLLYGDFNLTQATDAYQVIPTSWVQAAQRRWRDLKRPDRLPDVIAIDPARGGEDQTGICYLWDNYFIVRGYPGKSTPDGPSIATLIFKDFPDNSELPIGVDAIGVGGSVIDSLRAYGYKRVNPINVQRKSTATAKTTRMRFINLRAQLFWRFREALDPDTGLGLALPPGPEILADLTAARYRVTMRGIQIEDKPDIKSRLGRSPDLGEAMILAWHTSHNVIPLTGWSPDLW